jgi:hypothetical protein
MRNPACLLASLALFVVACSAPNDTSGPSTEMCEPYTSDADVSMPVSFAASVAPLFKSKCAGCHGGTNTSPYLGAVDGGVDAASILASIIGVEAGEDPTMAFVAPHDPAKSYLMHKLDGDECTLAAECALSVYNADYPNCGATMPFLAPTLLPVATRDRVRAWIFQGAQNN